jgi:hypothetical protein
MVGKSSRKPCLGLFAAWTAAFALASGLSGLPISAVAAPASVACAGAALSGGAQLLCSQRDPQAPAQLCSYAWALVGPSNAIQVVQGTFLIPPRASNFQAWQGSGYSNAASNPVILCNRRRTAP